MNADSPRGPGLVPALPPGWWKRVRHDLRGSVAPVRMAVQLLRNGGLDAAERDEALEVIDRQVELLLAGVEDLSDLLRIQAGAFDIRGAEHRDANLLLDVVCGRGMLMRELAARKLSLRCDPCEAEALVGHDPARVAELLEFLLLRIAAHAAPGTELVLGLRKDQGVSLHLKGAGPTLAADAELQHLLGEAEGGEAPSLRGLLMRHLLETGAMQLRRDGEGGLALYFADGE